MNAIQFIKEHGVERARELLARLHKLGCPDDMQITVINGMWHRTTNGFTYPDLKRLVESVDIINELGSLKSAKANLREMYSDSSCDWVHENARLYDYEHLTVGRVKQAIADYEQLFGNTATLGGEHV